MDTLRINIVARGDAAKLHGAPVRCGGTKPQQSLLSVVQGDFFTRFVKVGVKPSEAIRRTLMVWRARARHDMAWHGVVWHGVTRGIVRTLRFGGDR